MSRKKLILSILLMLFLLVVGIALPTYFRKQREDTPTPEAKVPASEQPELSETEPVDTEFINFDELEQFFSTTQIQSLTEQFASYFQQAGLTDITAVTFLADETDYPDSSTIQLTFALSSGEDLPVFYDTPTGVFSFGKEKLQVGFEQKNYEKPTDDSLPEVTTDEVELRQEGGYPDVTAPPQETEETPDTKNPNPQEEVQP